MIPAKTSCSLTNSPVACKFFPLPGSGRTGKFFLNPADKYGLVERMRRGLFTRGQLKISISVLHSTVGAAVNQALGPFEWVCHNAVIKFSLKFI